jgi:L-alanine-DL-glutamate epimerase-like enolase superfamily enzyme
MYGMDIFHRNKYRVWILKECTRFENKNIFYVPGCSKKISSCCVALLYRINSAEQAKLSQNLTSFKAMNKNDEPKIYSPKNHSFAEERLKENIKIQNLKVSAYTIPTETPEADGTLEWDSTTLILVEIIARGKKGIGYTYANAAAANFIYDTLKQLVINQNALNVSAITNSLIHHTRNNGNTGLVMMTISAVDSALWDLKAKLFDVPLCVLLGQVKDAMLLYGSGGFTSYSNSQLQKQFKKWIDEGIKYLKMKIGTHPEKDIERVRAAKEVTVENAELFVDANGAYTVKQALQKAEEFSAHNVTWFEEPVTSDNLQGLNFIREHAPSQMNIAAGEYGYNLYYFKQMLSEKAVDILQADATRCGGITGFLNVGILCEAFQIPFSSHCAPALHLHAALASRPFYIAEYFFDHVRIESMLFDGVSPPVDGYLLPDLSRPGLGIEFKHKDAEKYKL